MSFDFDVGARLKQVRNNRGLSQRELAKRAGVTNSTVSLIEQNRVSPSVASLKKVLDGLPMSMEAFFTEDQPELLQVFYDADELTNIGLGSVVKKVVGYNREQRSLSLAQETFPPSCDTGISMLVADGDYVGMIVSGQIELTVNGQRQVLQSNDAFYIGNQQTYRMRNIHVELCIIITSNQHRQA